MNNRHKVTTSLLAVIAVLLALNLFTMSSQTANAETVMAGGEDPYIVKLLPIYNDIIIRVWSDGRRDDIALDLNCGFTVGNIYGSVDYPFPVIDEIQGSIQDVMMTFEDGRVDTVGQILGVPTRCTIAGVGTPSLCTADTNRNGVVDTEDLLELFAQWGSCQ